LSELNILLARIVTVLKRKVQDRSSWQKRFSLTVHLAEERKKSRILFCQYILFQNTVAVYRFVDCSSKKDFLKCLQRFCFSFIETCDLTGFSPILICPTVCWLSGMLERCCHELSYFALGGDFSVPMSVQKSLLQMHKILWYANILNFTIAWFLSIHLS